MNCTGVRKFLYAFADGQLGVRANCEVLDHLKMCPACSRLVDEHHALRAAVGRVLASVKTPESLRGQVHERLNMAADGGHGVVRMLSWRRRTASTAIAAGLLLAVTGAWWTISSHNRASSMSAVPVRVEAGPTAATMIAEVHRLCLANPARHQSPDLPRDRTQIASAINQHFTGRIATVAPNLTRFGYEFESANFCGIDAQASHEGGHLIYASADHRSRISLFSVPRLDRLDQYPEHAGPSPDGYLQYEVAQEGGTKLSILAWHRNATSYACCGNLPIEKLRAMVSGIRLAMPDFEHQIQLAMNFSDTNPSTRK